jgi:hypothetical protein
MADYSSTKTAGDKLAASGTTRIAPSTATAASLLGATTPSSPPAAMSPLLAGSTAATSGPYDAGSYKPSTTATAAATSPATSGTAERYQTADRYGITPVDAISPAPADNTSTIAQQVPNGAAAPSVTAGNRYGVATASVTVPQGTVAGSSSQADPTALTSSSMAKAASNAPATIATPTASTTPPANATVQTTTPGQYRPGGTSSYIGSLPAQNMEVAARPAPPATMPTTSTATPATGGTIPWTPAGTVTSPTQRY